MLIGFFERVVVRLFVTCDLLGDSRCAGQQTVELDAEDNIHHGAGGATIAVRKRVYPIQFPQYVSREMNRTGPGPVIVHVLA
jgi:hypothetical protein